MIELDSVHCCDALELLHSLEPQSADAIITDLPYGTTAASWDVVIPFAPLWEAVRHALKPRGVFVTTASQPFTSMLVMSNLKWFRYEWIWDKANAGTGLLAQTQPLRIHEHILVFSASGGAYHPQTEIVNRRVDKSRIIPNGETFSGKIAKRIYDNGGEVYPKTILTFSNADQTNKEHPTQKPVALYEYLILTYTQPNALVVDPCCGSGTTGVAARNTNRRYIIGDTSPEYIAIARKRLAQPYTRPMFE